MRRGRSAAHRALAGGVPFGDCFVRSFMDDFEWVRGNTERFGPYRVDHEAQRRMAKESAFWYRGVMASNGIDIAAPSL